MKMEQVDGLDPTAVHRPALVPFHHWTEAARLSLDDGSDKTRGFLHAGASRRSIAKTSLQTLYCRDVPFSLVMVSPGRRPAPLAKHGARLSKISPRHNAQRDFIISMRSSAHAISPIRVKRGVVESGRIWSATCAPMADKTA
jgi:hypothetical protein